MPAGRGPQSGAICHCAQAFPATALADDRTQITVNVCMEKVKTGAEYFFGKNFVTSNQGFVGQIILL